MNFERFGPSRDLLYFCCFFLGAALGAFLISRRRACTLHDRSRWISALFCFASAALAALAGSVILSRGLVFTAGAVYPAAVLFLGLGTLALRFPRAGGCTIILAAGLFMVWLCFSFFIYPRCDEPLRLTVRSSGSGELVIRRGIFARGEEYQEAGPAAAETWNIPEGPAVFEAASVTAPAAYPLIGGERRGTIVRVTRNGQELFALAGRLYQFRFSRGFTVDWHTLELPGGVLAPGVSIAVLFNGQELYFDPPIQP